MAQVPGPNRIAEVKSGSTDRKVGERDHATGLFRIGVDLCRSLGHLLGERLHWDCGKNDVQVLSPLPGPLRCVGTVETVLQFDYGNGREHDFRFTVHLFERGQQFTDGSGITLGGDQHAGVED